MNRIVYVFICLLTATVTGCVRAKVTTDRGETVQSFDVKTTPELVERGRYLTHHVAACVDCHSRRDWSRLAGPLLPGTLGAGGQEYGKNYGLPGRYYGRNLTPAALKNWSDQELLVAITAGVNKQGKPLFPLMPYRNYHQMQIGDAMAIIAYLRTLMPIANDVPPTHTPAPLKLALRLMPHRAVLRTERQPGDTIPQSDVAYGRYLTQLAGCADCHTKRIGGNLLKQAPFAGGMAVRMEHGTVRSANLTPDAETGIGRWTRADFINRFRAYAPATYQAPPVAGGFNTIMPWTLYAGMTDPDLGAIYDYLRTVKPVKNRVMVFTAKPST